MYSPGYSGEPAIVPVNLHAAVAESKKNLSQFAGLNG
jgi:hypothetical protein